MHIHGVGITYHGLGRREYNMWAYQKKLEYPININNKDFFELHYSTVALKGEQEVLDTFSFLLGDLLSDNSLKHLRPILKDEQ